VTILRIPPNFFCRSREDYEPFVKKIVRAAKG